MRRVAWMGGVVTLFASAVYLIVYLYRWEWHRATFVAMVFVAAEVALATGLVLRKLSMVGQSGAAEPDPRILAAIRDRPRRDHFAWLQEDLSRTHVFVTVLLGGGVIVSALTWMVDRIARKATSPALDRSLARRLQGLSFPEDGLVADDAELLASDIPYGDDPDLRLLLGPAGAHK